MMDVRTPVPSNGGDWLNRFGDAWKSQASRLRDRFPGLVQEIRMPGEYPTDVPIVMLAAEGSRKVNESIPDLLRYLKETPEFEYDFLADITATDEGGDPRFEVVYNLFSTKRFWRIRMKARVRDGEDVPTAVPIWPGADWAEREIWDMFGIRFRGHPDLRRILMDERWVGHPLRKDYPLKARQMFDTPQPADPSRLLSEQP